VSTWNLLYLYLLAHSMGVPFIITDQTMHIASNELDYGPRKVARAWALRRAGEGRERIR
jgi:hypothetical protein